LMPIRDFRSTLSDSIDPYGRFERGKVHSVVVWAHW
jgi:hypothetical protein